MRDQKNIAPLPMPHAPHMNDVQLAAALGTDRKSLRRWRARFPRDVPQGGDVAEWRRFIADNCLGPHSARMGYGEGTPAVTAAAPDAGDVGGKAGAHTSAICKSEWSGRRAAIFEMMELLHTAYTEGNISPKEYPKIGAKTIELLIALGEAWNAGIDAAGYRLNWCKTLAAAQHAAELKTAPRKKAPRAAR